MIPLYYSHLSINMLVSNYVLISLSFININVPSVTFVKLPILILFKRVERKRELRKRRCRC